MSYNINKLHTVFKTISIMVLFFFLVNAVCTAAELGASAQNMRNVSVVADSKESPSSAVPVDFMLQRFRLEDPGNVERQLLILWVTPKPPYGIYAHESGGSGLPLSVRAMALDTAEILPVFYVPGSPKPDPLESSVSVAMHTGKTPIFMIIPNRNAGAELSLSLLLCSNKNCIPVRKKWTVNPIDDKAYAALPDAGQQPWQSLFQEVSGGCRTNSNPGISLDKHPDFGDRVGEKKQENSTGNTDGAFEEDIRLVDSWGLVPQYARPDLEVSGLTMAVLLGLCAGALLNIMPCVLPVISLKLSAFAVAAGTADKKERIRRFRQHTLFFSAGILVWFAILSFALGGGNSMWGQFFQQPWLVSGILGLTFCLSLSLFGLYSLPLLQFGQSVGEKTDGPRSAFVAGFFATILATPCSGPLLGGVLGYAFQQPPLVSGAVFMSIGVGMALPYLLLALKPGLAARFPKPGPWLRIVGKSVAFLLLATCGYLFVLLPFSWWVPSAIIMLLLIFLFAVWGRFRLGARCLDARDARDMSVWKWLRAALAKGKDIQSGQPDLAPRWKELWAGIVVIAVALFLIAGSRQSGGSIQWEPFHAVEFDAALGTTPLLVEFTADWCPNCKVLERTVLTGTNLEQWQKRYGLRAIKVDLSRNNAPGQALLERLGSASIPVVALFPAGEEKNRPLVLRDLFGKATLEDALRRITP